MAARGTEAMVIDAANGMASFPAGLDVNGTLTGTAVTQSATDTSADRLLKVGDFGLGAMTPPAVSDLTTALAAGFYSIPDMATATGVPAGQSGAGTLLVMGAAAGATFSAGIAGCQRGPRKGSGLGRALRPRGR